MEIRTRNRLFLVLIVAVFAAPLLAAWLLTAAGWRPSHLRNAGTLVQPPADVSGAPVTLSDGSRLLWRDPQWHWTLLALARDECGGPCQTRLAEVVRMRITLGRNADRLRIVLIGATLPPAQAAAAAPLLIGRDDTGRFAGYRPSAPGALALALVDPNGFLMLHYDAGYDAARLRQDVVKVVH